MKKMKTVDAKLSALGVKFDAANAEWKRLGALQDALDRKKPRPPSAAAAEQRQVVQMRVVDRIVARIMATRANSLEGIRVKVRVHQEWRGDFVEDDNVTMASLAADLDAMDASGPRECPHCQSKNGLLPRWGCCGSPAFGGDA